MPTNQWCVHAWVIIHPGCNTAAALIAPAFINVYVQNAIVTLKESEVVPIGEGRPFSNVTGCCELWESETASCRMFELKCAA